MEWTAIPGASKAMTSRIPRASRAWQPWLCSLTGSRRKRNIVISASKPWKAEGANDFASLYETLSRRYAHAAREAEEGTENGKFTDLPDLILIDGGPQQLRFARQAILDLGLDPPAMFGLAERLEEIWLPDAKEPILLDHRTPELQLVQRVRNEAHRFGIIHHRALRGKASVHSQLEDIPGIGPARRKALQKTFGSLKAIRAADTDTLASVPGMNRAAAEAVRAWAEKK